MSLKMAEFLETPENVRFIFQLIWLKL